MRSLDKISELIKAKANDKLEDFLKENPEVFNGLTEQGISYLMFAIYCRNKAAIELIRKNKNWIDIYEAAAIGELPDIKTMVERNRNSVNSYSTDGFTPLGLASFFGHLPAAHYLIENGADVNIISKNLFKVAPIHSACAISHYELAELLLSRGANVNAKQISDVTPLHEAAHNGHTKLVELLLIHGAHVNAKMETGQTPLFMAEENSYFETAEVLRNHGGV
ncbi:MAG: ankyrin repeat-containing protein [Bacteroidota bacterium]|nr:ankyrin repeat-containing protein [Bacteroidota bacterium]